MASSQQPTKPSSGPHWRYFRTLCEDVEHFGRFVELVPENYGTYSIEIVRLLLTIGSEIDVVLKLICEAIDPSSKAKNITGYFRVISKHYPEFPETIITSKIDYHTAPWREWREGKTPEWWRAYNDVKHERNRFFSAANIGNLLEALAGLCVAVNYYQQMALKEQYAPYYTGLMQLEDKSPRYSLNWLNGMPVQPLLPKAKATTHFLAY